MTLISDQLLTGNILFSAFYSCVKLSIQHEFSSNMIYQGT